MMSRAILGPREYHQLKLRCFRGFAEVTVVSVFVGGAWIESSAFDPLRCKSVSQRVSRSFISTFNHHSSNSVSSQSVSHSLILSLHCTHTLNQRGQAS